MLGLGVASFSYMRGLHFQNQIGIDKYQNDVKANLLPLKRAYRLTPRDQMIREFVLQLKLGEVSIPAFCAKFGEDIRKVFEEPLRLLLAEGHLTFSELSVRLTPQGLLQVDRFLPLFFDPQFRDIRYT